VRLTMALARSLAAAIAVAWLGACSGPDTAEPKNVASGREAYMANCASCHSANPNLGSTGPPIAGSPRQLVEARILHQSYPPGYKPKRNSHLMRKLPWLAPKIDDLTAFLASAKQNGK
jgi:mono/diheme cytochrome c family protein